MRKRMLTTLTIISIVLAGLLLPTAHASASGPVLSPPGKYYLSLGDSLAYGYQQFRVDREVKATGTIDPATFNTGYTDDFARMLQTIDPAIQTVNLGCPGETTESFIQGCANPGMLHVPYRGSQLAAALAFLRAHPGQVSPITIDLGSNDLLHLVESTCQGLQDLGCVTSKLPATIKQLATNLTLILTELRQAAPTSEIIVLQFYNPLAVASAASDQLVPAINDAVAVAASAADAVVVNPFPSFNLAKPQPQTLCTLSAICTSLHDIHPTDAGYLTIAQLLFQASGYAALETGFIVTFTSADSGTGRVYFGSGPGCLGLVEVATRDLQPAGTTHTVYVTGNDLPGSVGDNGIIPGVTYYYEDVTITSSGEKIDNNGGKCYQITIPKM